MAALASGLRASSNSLRRAAIQGGSSRVGSFSAFGKRMSATVGAGKRPRGAVAAAAGKSFFDFDAVSLGSGTRDAPVEGYVVLTCHPASYDRYDRALCIPDN